MEMCGILAGCMLNRAPLWQQRRELDHWLFASMDVHLNSALGTELKTPAQIWLCTFLSKTLSTFATRSGNISREERLLSSQNMGIFYVSSHFFQCWVHQCLGCIEYFKIIFAFKQ